MTSTPAISLADARRVVDAALARAEELGVRVSVVVVDSGGNLQLLARMDGTPYLVTVIARSKANTAAGFGIVTQDFGQLVSDIPLLLNTFASLPGVSILPGGLPVLVDGVIAGGIGVSGGLNGEDQPIAESGLAALATVGVAG
jgi:glc operon protein GlcG